MKPRYKAVIFDFDGTVVDTTEGICKSAQYALARFGIHEWLKDLTNFVGPPLIAEFRRYAPDNETAAEMVKFYTERYKERGANELFFYPGIRELLSELRAAGCRTAIASSKYLRQIEMILEQYGAAELFDVVVGPVRSDDPLTKTGSIERALSQLGEAPGSQQVCMIGDRFYDAEGAKDCALPFIAVLYGGVAEDAEFAPYPDAEIARTMEDLRALLLCE